jgi:tryptophanyl-tRNA synthetase
MSIKTDSAAIDAPKPLTSALYDLLKIMAPPGDFAQIDLGWRSGGKGYAEYKRLLLDLFHATFDAARERRKQLLAAPDEVERVLMQGARRAREIAAPVMSRVRRVVGLSV